MAERIGPHDLGGLAAGPVDPGEHDIAYWERMVDAMVRLLVEKGIYGDVAQLRVGIESLGPDAYHALGYYERWAASAARICVAKGVVSQEELDARVAALADGGAGDRDGGGPA